MIERELLNLLGKDKRRIAIMVLCNLGRVILNTTITCLISLMIYYAIGKNKIINNYIYCVIGILVAIILKGALNMLSGKHKGRIGIKIRVKMRRELYSKLVSLGTRSTNGINMAGLTQLSMDGIEQLDVYYSRYLPLFFSSMISPLILFIIAAIFDWRTGLILLAGVPIIPISIMLVSKYAKKVFAKYWGRFTSMGDAFLDNVLGMVELKIFRADQKRNDYMNEQAEEFRRITMKVLVMQLWSITIMDLVAFGGAAISIVMAINSVQNGNVRYMGVAGGIFLVLLAADFFIPLKELGSAFHVAMNGVTAGKKVLSLLNQDECNWGNDKFLNENIDIEVKNLTFGYNKEKNVLDNINLKFEDKKINAIVGASGSGKSTIANLLLRQFDSYTGDIYMQGKNIRDFSKDSYFSTIAFASAESYVFGGTIRENFLSIKENISDDEIYDVLKKVQLYDVVKNLKGLDMKIQEGASNLSGGEKQRLLLALNLVNKKRIYIFDEATSSIDGDSEKNIMDNIKELSKDSMVIIITHKLQNVVEADKIYELKNGKVANVGTHKELMEISSDYNTLYKFQTDLERIGGTDNE